MKSKHQSFNELAWTKNRLLWTSFATSIVNASDFKIYNFRRWIKVYMVHCWQNNTAITFDSPADEIFSTTGAAGATINNSNDLEFRLGTNQWLLFPHPVLTRSLRVGSWSGTGLRNVYLFYR